LKIGSKSLIEGSTLKRDDRRLKKTLAEINAVKVCDSFYGEVSRAFSRKAQEM